MGFAIYEVKGMREREREKEKGHVGEWGQRTYHGCFGVCVYVWKDTVGAKAHWVFSSLLALLVTTWTPPPYYHHSSLSRFLSNSLID